LSVIPVSITENQLPITCKVFCQSSQSASPKINYQSHVRSFVSHPSQHHQKSTANHIQLLLSVIPVSITENQLPITCKVFCQSSQSASPKINSQSCVSSFLIQSTSDEILSSQHQQPITCKLFCQKFSKYTPRAFSSRAHF